MVKSIAEKYGCRLTPCPYSHSRTAPQQQSGWKKNHSVDWRTITEWDPKSFKDLNESTP